MNDNMFEGDIDINRTSNNENAPLNIGLSRTEILEKKSSQLRAIFIIPIILLSVVDIIIPLVTDLNHSESESEYFGSGLSLFFFLPLTAFDSILIILNSLFCLDFPLIKMFFYVLLLLGKGVCVIVFFDLFSETVFSCVLMGIAFFGLCVCLLIYTIKLCIVYK